MAKGSIPKAPKITVTKPPKITVPAASTIKSTGMKGYLNASKLV